MKGPGGRLKFDVRRMWECPKCRRRELTAGDVVHRPCAKCSDATVKIEMTLLEEKKAPRPAAPPGQAAEAGPPASS